MKIPKQRCKVKNYKGIANSPGKQNETQVRNTENRGKLQQKFTKKIEEKIKLKAGEEQKTKRTSTSRSFLYTTRFQPQFYHIISLLIIQTTMRAGNTYHRNKTCMQQIRQIYIFQDLEYVQTSTLIIYTFSKGIQKKNA